MENLSLEDFPLGSPPLPELSSDSEACSSTDDLGSLVSGSAVGYGVSPQGFPGRGLAFPRASLAVGGPTAGAGAYYEADKDVAQSDAAAAAARAAWERPEPIHAPLTPPPQQQPPAKANGTSKAISAPASPWPTAFGAIALPPASPDKRAPGAEHRRGRKPSPEYDEPVVGKGGRSGRAVEPPTEYCRFFASGYCSRGDKCQFAHVPPELLQGGGGAPISASSKAIGPQKKAPGRLPQHHLPVGPQQVVTPGPHGHSGHAAYMRNGRLDGETSPPAPLSKGQKTSPRLPYDVASFSSVDQAVGHMYALSKDQHGCRFLQKQLEEQNPRITELIFLEIAPHFVELMTDPFGNYLCQKLLEYANEKQRQALVEKVAPHLVHISQNMHGTRAVQKMIEFLTTPAMIQAVVQGLRSNVVTLIQDLNGNHVIQRCLNRLRPHDNQFIYDAVARHCIQVATHRHGCCVMQRCIDFASEEQKWQLINEIVRHSYTLVQDPFGNYVVQYIMDLPYPDIANQVAKRFMGHLTELSTQKFSSNVIEKCLKQGDPVCRAAMINEIMEGDNLVVLLQDPYGNYVVQTALSVSDADMYAQLVARVRPHLPSIRNTPYGKRIQNKILKESKSEKEKKRVSYG
jgi:hypothetical protein